MTTTCPPTTTTVALRGASRGYGRGVTDARAVYAVFRRGIWTTVRGPSGSGRSALPLRLAGRRSGR